MKLLLWIVCVTKILVIGNWVSYTNNRFTIRTYQYGSSNTDFCYGLCPAKGSDLSTMQNAVSIYKDENDAEVIVCRDFAMNYLKFWNWYDYLANPYWGFTACPKEVKLRCRDQVVE